MSRLKGADLGITTPTVTLASLGGAKHTVGSGLPSLVGRNAGDLHYDPTAKLLYTLTGAASTAFTDSFTATDGTSISGRTLDTGGVTWSFSQATSGYGTIKSNAAANTNDGSGVIGYGGGINAATSVGRVLSANVWATAAMVSGNTEASIALGSATTGGTAYAKLRYIPGSTPSWSAIVNNSTMASGNATGASATTSVPISIEYFPSDQIRFYVNGVLVYTYTTSVVANTGQYDQYQIITGQTDSGKTLYLDNFSDVKLGTLAWTPATVANAMNYRGTWTSSPSPAYAVNDVVLRNGLPYVATVSPGSTDPIGGLSNLGAYSGGTQQGGFSGTSPIGQPFTVTSTITVSAVKMTMKGGGSIGGKQVGIASAIGASVTWLSYGTSTAGTADGSTQTVTLSAPVTLSPGTTYYFVNYESWLAISTTGGAASGVVSVSTQASYNSTFSTTAPAGNYLVFELDGRPWSGLSSVLENVNVVAASGASQTLPDTGTATEHKITLTANTTITLPTPGAGKSFTVELVQDGTGGRTVTWATPSGAIRWAGGSAPTITATANAVDVLSFACIGGTNWYGWVLGQALS